MRNPVTDQPAHPDLSRRRALVVARVAAMLAATGVSLSPASMSSAWSQAAYPNKPITMVVPQPPGGSVDAVGRSLAEQLSRELGQNVVVENRAGASGMIGAQQVANAAPDGYTIYLNASIHSIVPLLYKSTIKYDAVKDFTAIGLVAQAPLLFTVNPSVPATTVQELVSVVKAAPSKYSGASSGNGSAGHLSYSEFLFRSGLDKLGVPVVLYKGAAPAVTDLIGGQVHMHIDPIAATLAHVRSGRLRALATTGVKRSPLLPDVPTMQESGYANFAFYSWYGLWTPARLPAPIVEVLQRATQKAVASPAFVEKMQSLGFEATWNDSAAFSRFIDSEIARYQTIIDRAGIKVD